MFTLSDIWSIASSDCTFNNFLTDELKIPEIGMCHLCTMRHLMMPVFLIRMFHTQQKTTKFWLVEANIYENSAICRTAQQKDAYFAQLNKTRVQYSENYMNRWLND